MYLPLERVGFGLQIRSGVGSHRGCGGLHSRRMAPAWGWLVKRTRRGRRGSEGYPRTECDSFPHLQHDDRTVRSDRRARWIGRPDCCGRCWPGPGTRRWVARPNGPPKAGAPAVGFSPTLLGRGSISGSVIEAPMLEFARRSSCARRPWPVDAGALSERNASRASSMVALRVRRSCSAARSRASRSSDGSRTDVGYVCHTQDDSRLRLD